MSSSVATSSETTLARRLTLTNAVMVVIGSVIGSGIFLTPQNVAASVQIPGIMIGVWILTGLLTLAGALTNAEVASLIPEAGGQYVFFRVTFKQLTAFLYGWTTFIVYQTGSIAAIAVAFAKYFGYFVDLPHFGPELEAWKLPLIGNIYPLKNFGVTMVAILAIITVTSINYFGVQFGGMIQNVFTFLKVLAIGSIIVLAFTVGHGNVQNFFPLWGTPSNGLIAAVGVAMIATLWSYDGWNSLTFLAGEVVEPQKNIPRALILGTVGIIIIYVLTNLAYLYILPIGQIAQSKLVAADVMNTIFPAAGGAIISAMVMISTFGTVNASSMTTARVFYAMAKDKMFFKRMGEVHPKFRTPAKSLVIQGVWASILCLTGTYDQIFTYVIFAGWIFYALGAFAVFILRAKQPDAHRAYKVPLYPVVPIVFILVATWFVINTIVQQTADSMVGLLLVAAGIPFYLYWQRQMKKA
ncbi:MAG: amino acid permease [Bacteroidota bacterium]|jgi:APA family basic amino acid/polyamine antiporter